MRGGYLLAALAAASLAGGCAIVSPPKKEILVYGESFATTDEAVGEARLAIANASQHGCKAISVGNGAGAAGEVEVGAKLITVVVLLECPMSAPNIVSATGLAP